MPKLLRASLVVAVALSAALVLPVPSVYAASDGPSAMQLRSFAQCISRSRAKFYGAHWCPHCVRQKEMFGKAASSLPYVECFKPGTRDKLRKCDKVSGFPRWIFADGTEGRGLQSFAALGRATGCAVPE